MMETMECEYYRESMEFEYYRTNTSKFSHHYFCYPFFPDIQKQELEKGDKILMPPSALQHLIALEIDFPVMFSVQNPNQSCRTSHCGVLEFTSEEGFVCMPQWMMDNLKLQEGNIVLLTNAFLPKGTYIKLLPHSTDFISLSNPKAFLERTLKKYTCLTSGDTITIAHNEKKFRIDVLETKPASAVSIIDTDCEVDFAAPVGDKEPDKKAMVEPADAVKPEERESKEKHKFVPFTGLARRLDGIPVLCDDLVKKLQKLDINEETSSKTYACKGPGKMVFGSDVIGPKPLKNSTEFLKHDNKGDVSKNKGNRFQAFTGRSCTLWS